MHVLYALELHLPKSSHNSNNVVKKHELRPSGLIGVAILPNDITEQLKKTIVRLRELPLEARSVRELFEN